LRPASRLAASSGAANAQISDDVVKIGAHGHVEPLADATGKGACRGADGGR
jgi:hypothetical protein